MRTSPSRTSFATSSRARSPRTKPRFAREVRSRLAGMSAPDAHAKAPAAPARDAYVELAERIFVSLAARVYGTLPASGLHTEHTRSESARHLLLQARRCLRGGDQRDAAQKGRDRGEEEGGRED